MDSSLFCRKIIFSYEELNCIFLLVGLVDNVTVRAEELNFGIVDPAEEWVGGFTFGKFPFGSYDIWQSVRRGNTVK